MIFKEKGCEVELIIAGHLIKKEILTTKQEILSKQPLKKDIIITRKGFTLKNFQKFIIFLRLH
jgi:hypothetical protein